MRIDAHDRGGSIDVVRQRGQGAIASKHDHQISGDKVGTTDVLPRLVIHLVVVARRIVEDGFEGHQAFIVDLFEVFLEDDQDVQSSPLISMHVALVQEHHPPFTDEKLSRSTLPSNIMEGTSPWGDSPDEQPKTGAGTSPAPQPVSISDGFAPMNQGTMLTGTTEMPTGQLIYLQPPSSAAKYIGVFVLIFGLLQFLGLYTAVAESVDPLTGESIPFPTEARVLYAVSSLIGAVGFIFAGKSLMDYKEIGVWAGILTIIVQLVLGLIGYQIGIPDGGLSEVFGQAAFTIIAAVEVFCSLICGLIVATPLFVHNNGLEKMKS